MKSYNIQETAARIREMLGGDVEVAVGHGKMSQEELSDVMTRMSDGEIDVLVCTTIIETGVDVPSANPLIIENADRMGLSQLHQLRGRIKRGFQASTCILLYSYPLSDTSRERLNIMRETEDGFLIAEKDLELRGGGEILGTRQSGFCEFRIADMNEHKHLLYTANKDAQMIVAQDEKLSTPRGEALRILLYLFERDGAVKTYLAG